jgi:3-hydroxyacyl-[acyl-carrier-protein] dehydratase
LKFVLIDRISELDPGRRIVARKAVSLAEEYLGDHFPTFPVLPGVLMLEAIVQASAWVVLQHLDFTVGPVVLKEARNVTYKSFVAPGEMLEIESICKEMTPTESVFTASGTAAGRPAVKATITLRHLRLADLGRDLEQTDEQLRSHLRALFERLWPAGRTANVAIG